MLLANGRSPGTGVLQKNDILSSGGGSTEITGRITGFHRVKVAQFAVVSIMKKL
jgi:hypothetical protein